MIPNQIYVLMYGGVALKAFTSWEGANEKMADYPPKRQEKMRVSTVELVNDDKS
jgi:hypothetical protein